MTAGPTPSNPTFTTRSSASARNWAWCTCPGTPALTFKWAHEVAAESRFEGDNFTLNFGVDFD
jgi:hypothetical protein